jgi:hypothetical protein
LKIRLDSKKERRNIKKTQAHKIRHATSGAFSTIANEVAAISGGIYLDISCVSAMEIWIVTSEVAFAYFEITSGRMGLVNASSTHI